MKHSILKRIYIVAIFLAVFLFVFYLLNFDFGGLCKIICNCNNSSNQELGGVPQDWLKKYGLKLQTEDELKEDFDNDTLSLADEYRYSTNPKDSDTDKDGYTDSEEIKAGYNPTGSGKMDSDKDGLSDFWEKENNLNLNENDYRSDPDHDNLPNYLEMRHGTDPNKFDTDGDTYGDSSEIRNGYDPSSSGDARPKYTLLIRKISVEVPVIWSKSALEKDLQEDLKKGIVRYPQTAIPGQPGNIVATGHSSNYVWAEGGYNYILKDLNRLEEGDEIIIQATQTNGKVIEYAYSVSLKEVVSPDNQKIFDESSDQELTLITCWPLNTNWKRLMIKAAQTK